MLKTLLLLGGFAAMGGALAACSQQIALIPLDGGEPGHGQAFASDPGELMVQLEGRSYFGRWTAPVDAAETGPAPRHTRTVVAGRYWGQRNADGRGEARLTAEDGSTLSCRFRYDSRQVLGSGVCDDAFGRKFSLRIHQAGV